MAERDDAQERTEDPTPRRLEQAREEGRVARSRELANLGLLLSGALALVALGPSMVAGLAALTRRGLEAGGHHPLSAAVDLSAVFAGFSYEALRVLAPLLLIAFLAALLVPLGLGGWSFAASQIGFKAERVDPIRGFARVFSLNGLVELVKALAKLVVVAGTAALILRGEMDRVLGLGRGPLEPVLAEAGDLLTTAFLVLCGALAVIAVVDVPYQYWSYRRQLRMSRQDLREEFKETEGRPEVRSRIRSLQREAARRRMMQEVPSADVVVTNPTHVAVALRYRPETMVAPRVVARGADLLAARIREIADAHGVPVVSAPPLARALYRGTRLGQEIPAGLYLAVAQVLAYVFALRRHQEEGGPAPAPPADLPVPDDLRRPL